MQFNTLFFWLFLSCLCLSLAQVPYDDCCLKYVKTMRHIPQRYLVGYRVQKTDGGCNIPAVIFTAKKGRRFCGNPRDDWVMQLQKKIDRRLAPENRDRHHLKRG